MITEMIFWAAIIITAYYAGRREAYSEMKDKVNYRRAKMREKREGIFYDPSGSETIEVAINNIQLLNEKRDI